MAKFTEITDVPVICLKEDFIIPKDTVFECVDGEHVDYISGNYGALIGIGKDATMKIIIDEEVIKMNPQVWEKL